MKRSGASIIIEALCRNRTDVVFGYPGGAVLPIYDELYRNAHRIRHILCAHEQNAAHAADGFARVTGRPGVVVATSGPGATNLVTGIANAYLDSVPMVVLTGNVAVSLLGRDSFQEVDIVGLTQGIVKHSFAAGDVRELDGIIDDAFRIASSGRPGPVLIDVPKSVQTNTCGEDEYFSGTVFEKELPVPDISAAVRAIRAAERPLVYAGGGVISSGAEDLLARFAEKISAPVAFSLMGLTAMPADAPGNLGMCGMHGTLRSALVHGECDLIVAVGVRFSDRATGDVARYRVGKKIIHIDIDAAEIGKNAAADIEVCGDAKKVLTALLDVLPDCGRPAWRARVAELCRKEMEEDEKDEELTPKNLIRTVARFCSPETVIVTDVGQHQMWTAQYFPFTRPRTLLTSGGLGAMGFGPGAAVGGCIACGRRRTVLFTGDGSFGMCLQELGTAVSYGLPLLIVILNNGVLGMVRQWQTMFYGGRYSSTTLGRKTDFPALARAFGAAGRRVDSPAELRRALEELPADGPVVLDCRIDRDEFVLPMIPPGGSAGSIITKKE